jgi:hypothetical protein
MAITGQFRTSIWGLDHSFTLEDVQRLQTQINYNESIEYLLDRGDIEPNDTRLLHHWEITSPIRLYQPRNGEEAFRYYIAEGHFEVAASPNNAFVDHDHTILLPRERRVYPRVANVIFVEIHGRVYSIVYGGNADFSVRTILMGRGLRHRRREEWGNLDEKLPQYTLGSDFFYWMYNKYGASGIVTSSFGDIEIRDVEGIGRFSDRQQHNTRGRGPNSTDELSNKTALGIDQLVYESDFNLSFENMNINLCMDEHSNCIIDRRRSVYIEDTGDVNGIEGQEPELLLSLYLEVIPGLLSAYHQEMQDRTWTPTLAQQAKRTWAIEVIEELSLHHGITKNDLNIPQ